MDDVEHVPQDDESFPHTPASAVLGLRDDNPVQRTRSFKILARRYWKPIYKYIRLRWRKSACESEEVTQEFFLLALEKDIFADFEPNRARFRTFVRVCVDRFVASYQRYQHAKKRGGGATIVPFDFQGAELEIGREQVAVEDPEELFATEWIKSLLQTATEWLQQECSRKGKEIHFRTFKFIHLVDEADRPSYEAVAAQLGISVTDVSNRLMYARRRFRAAILIALRECTASEDEMNAEARIVFGEDV